MKTTDLAKFCLDKNNRKDIGLCIKTALALAELKQEDLAKKLRFSSSAVSQILNGLTNPHRALIAAAELLQKKPEEIIEDLLDSDELQISLLKLEDPENHPLFRAGHQKGYTTGFKEGHEPAHDNGYMKGYTEGHKDGRKTGYEQGLEDGSEKNAAEKGIIANAPESDLEELQKALKQPKKRLQEMEGTLLTLFNYIEKDRSTNPEGTANMRCTFLEQAIGITESNPYNAETVILLTTALRLKDTQFEKLKERINVLRDAFEIAHDQPIRKRPLLTVQSMIASVQSSRILE